MSQEIISAIEQCRGMLLGYLNGIPDARAAEQPAGQVNHPAWTLGHLLLVENSVVHMLSGKAPVDLPANWSELYGMGSKPVSTRSIYQPLEFYVTKLAATRVGMVAAVKALKAEDFAKPFPDEKLRSFLPTIGRAVLFAGLVHEGYHAGQIASWRKAAGLPSIGM
ncbi:MAG: DinB family protein [Phycisphaerales bacterium]|nr:DinB family protein [Phycisphaerales bacterium]